MKLPTSYCHEDHFMMSFFPVLTGNIDTQMPVQEDDEGVQQPGNYVVY